MKPKKKIAVVLNMFQHYDRGILRGIAAYAHEHQQWSIYAEEEESLKMPDLRQWQGDGMITSFDDPNAAKMVQGVSTPVVGIGGGQGWYDDQSGIPYVGTDDESIGQLAAEHLIARGLTDFAFCGYPKERTNIWVSNRAAGFKRRLARDGFDCHHFEGRRQTSQRWDLRQEELAAWLRSLPKPIGLMGCYDSRARHVLEACRFLGLRVPDDVAVIGVDNNELTCELSEPPLSSVEQGTFGIGYQAARLLDQMMRGRKSKQIRHSIEPVGVVTRQSTNLLNVSDHEVGIALRRIRDEACFGLQADSIAAELHLSRSTLDTRFKKAIGRTVDQEIRQVRMTRAKELLARTNMPLREVAREAGYGSEQYLARMIREATQTTPARYRRDHQASRLSL
jgi:LacI family transcriptional regulator